ncbi:hypothetical protein MNB_SV-5-575 [hydrothermal vent metagenome]|uniref:DUF481 domain-containing protein n=1 Tax=hydrothermal vent metagenome TaxID=652676 RepID=A0A1W1EC68_9ZZZZ
MQTNMLKYFLLFIFLTMSASANRAEIVNEKPSPKEEIKDTIVVRGMVLYGKITKIGPERLSFKILYSDGISNFAYGDIDSIETKYNYHLSYNRMDIEGKVIGIEDNKYLKIITSDDTLRTVKISDIDNFVMSVIDDESFENRVRNKFPYTKGNINLGFNLESGSTTKRNMEVLLNLRHKQAEHELRLYVDYEFETRESETIAKYNYEDEIVSIVTYKNNFRNNQFYYGTLAFDYDKPRFIDKRYVPSIGYGRKFEYNKSIWIVPSVGLAYAATKYTEQYADKNFLAGALSMTGQFRVDDISIINTFILDGFVMYYPSLENPNDDWIFRSNINFKIPLNEFMSVNLAMTYVNDSNPDVHVGNNKSTTKLLFGLDF